MKTKNTRPMPEDFPIHGKVETQKQLMLRYGCGTKAISRWRKQCGFTHHNAPAVKPKPIPETFASACEVMTSRQVCEHFGIGISTMWKWCAKAGARPYREPKQLTAKRALYAGKGRPKRRDFGGIASSVHRDDSEAGRAANFLRRLGPLFRCDAQGHQLQDGFFWNRGGHILTDEDIIARAQRKGWNPEQWRALA